MVIMYKWNMTVLKANSSKLHVSRCLTAGLRFNWIDLILTPVLTPPPPPLGHAPHVQPGA